MSTHPQAATATFPEYSPLKPASPLTIDKELRLFRRKSIRRTIKRYLSLLFTLGSSNSWDFMESLAVIGYLKQHTPLRPNFDEDINFYVDFQAALWELDDTLRATFILRYVWDLTDQDIAAHLRRSRRTVLRWADTIHDHLYNSLRDYFIDDETELLDILNCRF